MTLKNHYQTLDVPPSASVDHIKRAYKKLVLEYHPDVSNAPNAEDRFKEIVEAYRTLSDTYKKFAYDQRIRTTANPAPRPPAAHHATKTPDAQTMLRLEKEAHRKEKANYQERTLAVDPDLKRLSDEELSERLTASNNYYVQINALYALIGKNAAKAKRAIKEAFPVLSNARLQIEILRFYPADNDKAFIAALYQSAETAEKELAKEIIAYLLRAYNSESKLALVALQNSKNAYVKRELARLYREHASTHA